MPLSLQQLILYPIKSLGGVSVTQAVVEPRGLRYDRRYMLVSIDPAGAAGEPQRGTFITQRTQFAMALIDVAMDIPANELTVWHRHTPDDVLTLPLVPPPSAEAPILVTIWDSEDVPAQPVSNQADAWFSRVLGQPCRLVYMPDTTQRSILSRHIRHDEVAEPVVSFADGFPLLVVTQASLDELNRRVGAVGEPVVRPLAMARFRPNLVVGGDCVPHDEDSWATAELGGLTLYGVKPCVRCVLTTIDPGTGERGPEPLRTLATYRRYENKVLFGENMMPALTSAGGTLRVGTAVQVGKRKEPWLPISV